VQGNCSLKVQAPAKINLYLEILDEDEFYHQIVTIIQTISLYDTLEFGCAPVGEINLELEGPFFVGAADNLIVKAARKLWEISGETPGVKIALNKNIPVGAGLGGGSSDGAATLVGLNRFWNLNIGKEELYKAAASLGSDVPFFLSGGCAVCSGRGEKIESVMAMNLDIVLVAPDVHVSTAEVYRLSRHDGAKVLPGDVLKAFESGSPEMLGASLFNRLQETTVLIAPEVQRALDLLSNEKLLGVAQSGSGGAVFGIADSQVESRKIAERLVRAGFRAWSLRSPAGCELVVGESSQ